MKLSRFATIVEDYPVTGENLVFNTRTQALIKIDHRFRDALRGLPGSLEAGDPRVREFLPHLRENGIVVEDEQEDAAKLADFFRQLKSGSSELPLEATILTTYGCNFRCVYCFEESVKRNLAMDEKTARAAADWLIRRARKRGIEKLFVVFYGGEPLLNTAPIVTISRALTAWAKSEGRQFAFGMITNGSLLTPAVVDTLLPLGLESVRVSVDGDRAGHDAKRPFADGSPSFDTIIANIESVIDKVPVAIAGNFDRANLPGIPRLLDMLKERGLLKKLRYVNFLPIAPRLGPRSNPGQIEMGECLSFFGDDGMFADIINLKHELAARGIKSPSGLAVNACSLVIEDAGVTIDPRGDIYLCNALLGYPEFSAGRVFDEDFSGKKEEFKAIDAWNKCAPDCPYIPMCQGGCRYFSYLEHQNLSSLVCKRGYYDRIVPELIKLEYHNLKGS